MALNSATNATELTAEQVSTVLVQPLATQSLFLSSGARIIDTAGPLRMPKGANPTTPDWYGQNELIVDEDPTFDEVELLPSTMKSVKVLTRFSNELARQSVVSLDVALRDRLVADVANVVDGQLFGATGDGVTLPKGLFAYAGQSVAVAGELGVDHMIDADGLALAAGVDLTSLTWVMNPAEFTNLRKISEGTASARKLFEPDATKPGALTFAGHKVIISKHVPAGNVALVDFSQIVVARDVAPSVKILDQTFGDFDQQAIRVVTRLDAKPTNDKAVIKLTGIALA